VLVARGVYLIGFSGTGKSTVARLAAAELGWPACDLDRVVAERSGLTIPAIFAAEGEAGFRDRETEALRAVAAAGPQVVATGGGAPLRPENRELMASSGWVVALEARPEALDERIRQQQQGPDADAIRPLLDPAQAAGRIRSLKEQRQPIYALADWTVHTDRLSPAEVAAEVVRAVRLLEAADAPQAAAVAPPPSAAGGKRLRVRGAPLGAAPPAVCVPLVGRTREALLAEAAAAAAKGPDLLEWRVDHYEGIARTGDVLELARELRRSSGLPLLLTPRSAAEGGRPVPLSGPQVVELCAAACADGCVDLVDHELASPPEQVRRLREVSRAHGVALVLSAHDLDRTPPVDEMVAILERAARAGADLAKLAVTPRSRADVLALLAAVLRADERLAIPVAGMSMGALGSPSRVCGFAFGSALTFAAVDAASAPGQLPIDDLRAALAVLRRAGPPAP
jgi:3-dehydroquinate dehydratase-1